MSYSVQYKWCLAVGTQKTQKIKNWMPIIKRIFKYLETVRI